MIYLTLIARISDGLPLAASVQDNESTGRDNADYQNQAKQLIRKLNVHSPPQMTIESGPFYFHILNGNQVCYLALCDKSYTKRLAFSFLEDLQNEFLRQFGSRIHTVSRPYSFIEFDNYIQKSKKSFIDSRSRRNLGQLNSELHDVQKIMVQNIDDVLQRGLAISDLDNKANNLSTLSQKYKKDARYLNLRATYAKVAAGCVVGLVIFIYFWIL